MKILIVESNSDLGRLWQTHMTRQGHVVYLAEDQDMAAAALDAGPYDIIILDVMLARGSAFAVADLASYRQPEVQIIFVTSSSFFSDGSIFSLTANACAFLQSDTPPEDLVAVAEHFGRAAAS
jgi:DNA-binding response OmpR family regulator